MSFFPHLWDVPGLGFRENDDHTLQFVLENNLTRKPCVLVKHTFPGFRGADEMLMGEDVTLIVGQGGQLVKPLLGDMDLAHTRAGVDFLKPMGRRVDQAAIDQGAEERVPRQSDDRVLVPIVIDGGELHDPVGNLFGSSSGGSDGVNERRIGGGAGKRLSEEGGVGSGEVDRNPAKGRKRHF